MPQLITRAFAETGDKMLPPDNDNAGFVSFVQGYTSDYEINLASGNVNAKAVERPIQNALFNLATDNLLWYQTHGFMQWYQAATYGVNDLVVDSTGTGVNMVWKVYRSRKVNPTTRPNAVVAAASNPDWEEVPLPSVARSLIPFQAGQDYINPTMPAAAFMLTGANLNMFTYKCFMICPSATMAATILNRPNPAGGTTKDFTIEVAVWTYTEAGQTNTRIIQRLVTSDGYIFVRGATNGAFTAWVEQATASEVQQGVYHWATCTGTANNATLNPTLGPVAFKAGMIIRYLAAFDNTGDYYISIGSQVNKLVLGRDMLKLPPKAIRGSQLVELIYDGLNWIMLAAVGGQYQVPTAVADNAAPTFKQLKDVDAKILNFNAIYPVGSIYLAANANNPATLFGGTWQKLPDAMVLRTTAAGQNPLVTGGQDSVTLNMNYIPQHGHAIIVTTSNNSDQGQVVTTSVLAAKTYNTTVNGAHLHSFSGATGNGGYHNHGAYTDVQGQHSHQYAGDDQLPAIWGIAQYNLARYDADSDTDNWAKAYWTAPAGAHQHGVVVNAAGDHQHAFSGVTSTDNGHLHQFTLDAHNHSFTIQAHNHTINGGTQTAGLAPGQITPVPTLPAFVAIVAWRRTA